MSLKQRQLQLIHTRLETDPNYKPSNRAKKLLEEEKQFKSLKIKK